MNALKSRNGWPSQAGAWVADRVLGVDPDARRLARQCVLAAVVYAASVCIELLAWAWGLADPLPVACLSLYLVVGVTTFYVLVRSGWNRRLADPNMSAPQIAFPLCGLLLAYPINGPFRGLNLLAVVLPPLFGFMSMSRRAGLTIVVSVPSMFGAMMVALASFDPVRFDPRVEAVHFAILTTCMSMLGVLLWQISSKRDRVRQQKVELARALERIEAISTRDELTGLYNRRYMTTRLEDEVGRRARGGAPFCVCLIDLDFFKRINDLHGHARGDAVLRSFAKWLQAALRDTDALARWGGEEFLLILPATTLADGLDRVERLRRHGAETADWGAQAELRVRFSAGVAADGGGSVPRILDQADDALYRAKALGRDRVVAAEALQAA